MTDQGAEPDFEGATKRAKRLLAGHARIFDASHNERLNDARAYLALSAEAALAGKLREALRSKAVGSMVIAGEQWEGCSQCGNMWKPGRLEQHDSDCLAALPGTAAPATEGRKG